MNYTRLSNEVMQKFPYPNLIAEWIESGYSICTLAEHMGIGKALTGSYRKEDDPEMLAKLRGEKEITASEALGLSRLFGVGLDYLFCHNLKIVIGKPAAYWHWFDKNKKADEEIERNRKIWEIERELRKKPYLLEFFKLAVVCSDEQLQEAIEYIESRKAGISA